MLGNTQEKPNEETLNEWINKLPMGKMCYIKMLILVKVKLFENLFNPSLLQYPQQLWNSSNSRYLALLSLWQPFLPLKNQVLHTAVPYWVNQKHHTFTFTPPAPSSHGQDTASFPYSNAKVFGRTGNMAQELRRSSRGPGSVPSTHTVAHDCLQLEFQGDLTPSHGFCRHGIHVLLGHTYKHNTDIY